MEWTGLNELREKYLSFFENKGHLRLPSFSLIPKNDSSLLIINSGMAPMKKWFTGEEEPPRRRVTTCQKCIRTPDIENVGKTARHGTYFEMLGNFSFGDYFKNEIIPWAWEFCTDIIKLDPQKLYITVYEEDDEAYKIWTKDVGVDNSHVIKLGKADNFWEHGQGPCGPCSEIHYDRGEKYGCGKPSCKVGCDCDRYIEFWNLVFTQFENDGNNNYSKLDHPNIDTGMGLERLACISQNVDNLFEVDTVQNIIKAISDIANVKYNEDEKTDISLRVITDHVRSVTMMIGDGIMPSNEGRGYVLRRLLRRAARHGRLLGIDRAFLYEIAETVISDNEDIYSNLREKHDFIINVIKAEEEAFSKTIEQGLSILNDFIANNDSKVMSGADAFLLSDTFGFPLDLTKDILAESDMTVNEEEYFKLLKHAKDKARAAYKDAGAEAWKSAGNAASGLVKTEFTGYFELETDSKIAAVISNGEKKEFASAEDDITIVLDKTPFYAESGGQVGDKGIIVGESFEFEVEITEKTGEGVYLHQGKLINGESIALGESVKSFVNKEKRHATERNHTAAHLLQAALRKVLGTHVEQAGQLVNENTVRFDFTHFSALTADELSQVEHIVNEEIMNAEIVSCNEMPVEEAKKLGAMALFGEKYGNIVRVVQAGDFSLEFCGGTHVKNTGNIGSFRILSESSIASGVRRIEAVTGFNTLRFIDERMNDLRKTAENLKIANIYDLASRAAAVQNELKEKSKEIEKLESKIAQIKVKDLKDSAISLGMIKLIKSDFGNASADDLKTAAEKAVEDMTDTIVVFAGRNIEKGTASFVCAVGKQALKSGVKAGDVVREVSKFAGGSGGGRPNIAQAGAKDISKISEALERSEEIIKQML